MPSRKVVRDKGEDIPSPDGYSEYYEVIYRNERGQRKSQGYHAKKKGLHHIVAKQFKRDFHKYAREIINIIYH